MSRYSIFNCTLSQSQLAGLLLIACVSGCGAEKESLHEHTHEEPKHWPADMFEAATFIEARMRSLESASQDESPDRKQTLVELQDLVEWSPEVAGDTALPEDDWLPIYQKSEAIRGRLQSADITPQDMRSDFQELASLLRAAAETVASSNGGMSQLQLTTRESSGSNSE